MLTKFYWVIEQIGLFCIMKNFIKGDKMKTRWLLFYLLTVSIISAQSIQLKDGWKFSTTDNMNFARADYNDADWQNISIAMNWDDQGYNELDGYAWYRIKVFIPSSIKMNSYLKDSIRIYLGKIDDYDQAFLNGQIFGINGRNVTTDNIIDDSFSKERPIPWNRERKYTLASDDPRILWDKENVIAIRVYDQGGLGGLFYGVPSISVMTLSEYLSCDFKDITFEYGKNTIAKNFSLNNISTKHKLDGTFSIVSKNKINGKVYYSKKYDVTLQPGSSQKFSFSYNNPNEPTFITYKFYFAKDKSTRIFIDEPSYILTPKPSPIPKINGAKVYGQRVGKPFLYTIAATGKRPIKFTAQNLPDGLHLDKSTGIINGSVKVGGEYTVTVEAVNEFGKDKCDIKFVIGNKLALTPPMGWNSWNVWGLAVDQDKVLASAKVFKEKLINHGWTFINIDDGWEIKGDSPDPKRDADGFILTNEKFPDMKALGDSLHNMGLKFGIYSSPGPLTCGGYTASYQHELKDAQSFASWGIDYLKYDWCSYDQIAKDRSLPELKKPFFVMRDALNKIDRDIVYSLCQYGMGKVWEWGDEVGGNLWRTTSDITDTWKSMSEIGFNQVENAKYAKPGNWNDPDMLVVGQVGWGPNLHQTRLTPDEQYTHISLWCLLSSPLLIGCDLSRADDFTLNLLTNDEVLAINQDPLGKQATPVIKQGNIQVWVKDLDDGNKAIGVFNLGENTEKYILDLKSIGIEKNSKLRDLWRQKIFTKKKNAYTLNIPSHGVYLFKTNSI